MDTKWFKRLAAAVLALAGIAVAAPDGRAQTPQPGGTLSVGISSDVKTLDPLQSVQFPERQVLYLIFNTLVKYGTDYSIQPELAESWEIQGDGKKIVFKLRRDVKFHDGTPFNAQAVKWNIERRLDPAVQSPQREQLEPLIASVEATDANTVTFNLKRPAPSLLGLLGERAGFMVSPTAAAKSGAEFGNSPVGTGAFVFKDWTRGSQINLEKNPNYWEKGLPYLDKIVFRDLASSIVGIQRLQTGELDFVNELSPNDAKQIEGKPGIKLYPITVGRWYSLQWRMDKPPFDNAKLRQAIQHGIDRKRINDIVMSGKGTISDSPTPKGLWWHDPSIKTYDYDPQKAKALLAEAGYPNGFEVVLSTPQIPIFQQIDQLVQEQLAQIGVKLKLEPVSSADWYNKLVDGSSNFSPTRWTTRPDPDGILYILFHSQGYANTMKYKNPKVDQLLDEARLIYDQAKRKPMYFEAQKLITADNPMPPLFFSVEYGALKDNVKGFEWIPDQIPRFRELWKAK
ncbi:MAG: ABC transporter substrate-binding protein [Alphaproteobacteria bacterium]